MIACTLSLPIFTAAKDEKYFRKRASSWDGERWNFRASVLQIRKLAL